MPRKRNPILRKAWDLIVLSVSPMARVARVRNPITRKLLLFKKAKRLKLLRHYNYAYIGEYQFSPSSTPLFRNPGFAGRRRRKNRLLALLCGGNGAESVVEEGFMDELEVLSASPDAVERGWPELLEYGVMDDEDVHKEEEEVEEEEDGSVDQRAEMFIRRFYEEMKIQRQDSIMRYKEMLLKGCS